MSLTTLAYVKAELGITGTSEDVTLTQFIAMAVSIARTETRKWLGGMISGNTIANPTVCTSIGHGLVTGDTVVFYGSNCTPTIDGARVVTVIDDNTFSVPVNVTVTGTRGMYGLSCTEYYGGSGSNILVLRQRPVHSITNIWIDNDGEFGQGAQLPFSTSTLLVPGTDYALYVDQRTSGIAKSLRGFVYRIGDYWKPARIRSRGLLSLSQIEGIGNVKVEYVTGLAPIPYDLQSAIAAIVAIKRRTAANGVTMSNESIDNYSYSLAGEKDQAESIVGVKRTLGYYKAGSSQP